MPHLTLPEQDLSSLTFCDATTKALGDWIGGLPLVNARETSRRLYHAVGELNRLKAAPQQRVALLELIDPPIHYACGQLAHHYLGHAASLTPKQHQVVNLAQALQLSLAAGYKQALTDLVSSGSAEKNQRLAAQCVYRAICALSSTILRSAQLYCPSPTGSWIESHRLFRFAHAREIADLSIVDSSYGSMTGTTVAEAYKRLLLIGCCRPNQLRQAELTQVYGLFSAWARHTQLSADQASGSLFVINPERDSPPLYRSLVKGPIVRGFISFDTTELSHKLCGALNELQKPTQGNSEALELPTPLNEPLILHLSRALAELTERSNERLANSRRFSVCLGMSATHYYSAGRTKFSQFLAPDAQAPFRCSPGSGTGSGADDHEPEAAYPAYRVPVSNASPGGGCLHWCEAVPAALQTGEVLAVREQDSQPWSLALIRWIRHSQRQGTRVGIEFLASEFVPCGVRLIQDQGKSSAYLRGILLSEPDSTDRFPSLLVPSMPFRAGDRVVLFQGNREEECQLSRCLAATGSVSQFGLEFAVRAESEPEAICSSDCSAAEEDFDALWPSL